MPTVDAGDVATSIYEPRHACPSMVDRIDTCDVLVVGAGASGLWSAAELAPDHDVLVVDAGEVGAGASGDAAGFVTAFSDWAPSPDAVAHSIAAFRALDGRHGFTFYERPYVELARTAAEGAALRETYDPLFERPGYDVEYLDAAELSARWPGRFDLDGVDGGLVKHESGIVAAEAYLHALASTARECGVRLRTNTTVESVVVEDGSVVGAETPDGRVDADVVVCTAGAGTGPLVEWVDLPVRRFVYSNLRVEADAPLDDAYPMVYADDVWWRPEPGRPRTFLVSGGTYFLAPDDGPPRDPPAAYRREVRTVLEGLAADVETATAVPGSYQPCTTGCVTTPDGLPVLDAPAAAPDGLVVATAVTGGISVSPFTGAAVRSLVTGADPPVPLAPFAADRFDEPPADFRVDGIREPLSGANPDSE